MGEGLRERVISTGGRQLAEGWPNAVILNLIQNLSFGQGTPVRSLRCGQDDPHQLPPSDLALARPLPHTCQMGSKRKNAATAKSAKPATNGSLKSFLPATQKWFTAEIGEPSPPQVQAWPRIANGENVLIHAPTGSGKTFAAFLSSIDQLFATTETGKRNTGVQALYISPLKALNNDIERNLRDPLNGIRHAAAELGDELPEITAEVRTGDTPQSARARMVRRPPHILITTPESLYLILTSPQARNMLREVKTVIVDEIHSISGTKRGVHLSLSLERLEQLSPGFQRIGLSATQKPLEEVARFLGGQHVTETPEGLSSDPRPVTIVDAQFEKKLEVGVVGMPDREIGESAASVWPQIIPSVLNDIEANRTTLVFANSRRQAEQATDRLNEQVRVELDPSAQPSEMHSEWAAPRETAESEGPFFAHHGSISDETRHTLEEALKAGELPALVGTSSLELGIDIGTVDLVVQLQSPKTVTQGLQRVGRSGHRVGETSRYRIYATHEEDLLEAAVVARGMADGDVEEVYTPQNALDVLSQQVIAAVAVDDWRVDDLFQVFRGAYPYHKLERSSFDAVLKLVSGKYPRHTFNTLRARVNWDEAGGMLRPLPGTRMHAVDNGGAIVDRGAFPVYLPDRKTRIGELDEEFVYESRAGDVFVLGSQVWRAADIDDDRVIVEPAPGAAPRMPFWRGEFPWRPLQLSKRLAEFKADVAARLEPHIDDESDPPEVRDWLQSEYFCDEPAARQIINYIRRQVRSTGNVASNRALLVETYSDSVGDRRVVVHSSFGGKVNGPWSVALSAVIKERTGVEPEVEVNDDGIMFRLHGADDDFPEDLLTALTPEQTRERVLAGLTDSALFGALFRQNAQRALLLPGIRRGRRTPFWLQRLRSKDLLAVSRNFADFPVMLETFRDCLEDAMDMPGLMDLLESLHAGEIEVTHHSSAAPSPVARALSFALEAWYMYQWDAPKAERSMQQLGLDREQLAALMRDPSFAGTLRPEALDEVGGQVAHTMPGRRARSATELAQLLEDLGDLTQAEVETRADGDFADWLERLESENRAARVELPSGEVWTAPQHAAEYSAVTSIGAQASPSDREALRNVLRRALGRSAALTEAELSARYGISSQLLTEELEAMAADDELAWGYFTAEAGEREWAVRQNLERIQARTLSILRSEIRPASPLRYQAELLHLQRLTPERQVTGADGLMRVLEEMQGVALPLTEWSSRVLPARVAGFTTSMLDQMLGSGDFVPALIPGSDSNGAGSERVVFVQRGLGATYLNESVIERAGQSLDDLNEQSARVMEFIKVEGTATSAELRSAFSDLRLSELRSALSTLLKSGLITTDSWIALNAALQHDQTVEREVPETQHAPAGIARSAARAGAGVRGRAVARGQATRRMRELTSSLPEGASWFPVDRFSVMGNQPDKTALANARALALLNRHGVVSRHVLALESNGWDWPSIINSLSLMELRGDVRRGYFVLGLPGVQFAMPETVERLRAGHKGSKDSFTVVSASDFAYVLDQSLIDASDADATLLSGLSRIPSNHVVFQGEEPILRSEANGERLTPASDGASRVVAAAVRALRDHFVPASGSYGNSISVRSWDGNDILGSPGEPVLEDAGFRRDFPAMTFDAVQSRALNSR